MATMLTKKTILKLSKSMTLYASPRLSTVSFSTAFERAEESNAVAEASSDDVREGTLEAKQEDLAMTNDAAKEGPIKAVEAADMVRDTDKDTMNGARKASQDQPAHKVRDTAVTGEDSDQS